VLASYAAAVALVIALGAIVLLALLARVSWERLAKRKRHE
jgi:hypothetical protein